MRTYIFTDRERQVLEAYVTKSSVDELYLSKIMQKIKKHKTLFEDVYLYLQVRKTLTT